MCALDVAVITESVQSESTVAGVLSFIFNRIWNECDLSKTKINFSGDFGEQLVYQLVDRKGRKNGEITIRVNQFERFVGHIEYGKLKMIFGNNPKLVLTAFDLPINQLEHIRKRMRKFK